jgi:hypothetical protein
MELYLEVTAWKHQEWKNEVEPTPIFAAKSVLQNHVVLSIQFSCFKVASTIVLLLAALYTQCQSLQSQYF